jgi:threonine aldolase
MSHYRIDLRSDIHARPTASMRQAMALADAGGDALAGEDSAVSELEETGAALFGKEAALLVCSGTMGNLVSLLAISRPGGAVIADPYTHIVSSEQKGFERLAGCRLFPIDTDGILTGEMVRQCLRGHGSDIEGCVICAENTHGLRGGVPWTADVTAGLVKVARDHGLKLHIDGARIFNAAAATNTGVADLTAGADTVQVCLSKGLAVPFGSLVLGSKEIIARARTCRQMLGGGVHKAGILAAAGLVALREMPSHICQDHRRARRLGDLLAGLGPLRLAYPVYTNIVDLLLDPQSLDGKALVAHCAERGLGIIGPWNAPSGPWLRLATYHDISDDDVEEAAAILAEAMRPYRAGRP